MFATRKVIDLAPKSMRDEFFTNPPPPYVLRDNSITLLEFYHELQGLFKFRACGAAHHFPWVRDQNPDSCPWMRTNPGCTHADTIVSQTFRWIEKIVNTLNEHCGHCIVDPREMQLVHDLFFNKYVMHAGSPNLTIYFKDTKENRRGNPDQPHEFSPELAQEVARVRSFQKEKSEFFFILCKFLSDQIQEVLLIPDELDRLPPLPEQVNFRHNGAGIPDSIKYESRALDKQHYEIPIGLMGTDIKHVIARMTNPKLIFPEWG